jgi:hypothetical protein
MAAAADSMARRYFPQKSSSQAALAATEFCQMASGELVLEPGWGQLGLRWLTFSKL